MGKFTAWSNGNMVHIKFCYIPESGLLTKVHTLKTQSGYKGAIVQIQSIDELVLVKYVNHTELWLLNGLKPIEILPDCQLHMTVGKYQLISSVEWMLDTNENSQFLLSK